MVTTKNKNKKHFDNNFFHGVILFKVLKITSGFTLTERWEAGNYYIDCKEQ